MANVLLEKAFAEASKLNAQEQEALPSRPIRCPALPMKRWPSAERAARPPCLRTGYNPLIWFSIGSHAVYEELLSRM